MVEVAEQIPLRIWLDDEASLDNFYPEQDINYKLIDYLRANQPSLLYLFGPKSSGVSHLLIALCKGAEAQGKKTQYIPLKDMLNSPAEMLKHLGGIDFLCIDDIDLVSKSENWQQQIFHLYNQVKEGGGEIIFGSHSAPSDINIDLADLRSRIFAGEVWAVNELSDEGKAIALQNRAEARGFSLSDKVTNYLINHQNRDMSSLMELLYRLDRLSLEQKKLITVPFIKSFL